MRRTKRFASFALAACMGVSLLVTGPAANVSAQEEQTVTESGSAENAMLEYATATDATVTDADNFDEDAEQVGGSVIIDKTGTEDAQGFVWQGTKIVDYKGDAENIVIPDGCTEIGEEAFWNSQIMKTLTLPATVAKIGNKAFGACHRLERISVNSANTVYNSNGDCNAVIETSTNTLVLGCKNTTIPDGITVIGSGAFLGCDIEKVVLPSSVTKLCDEAFADTELTTVVLPEGLQTIAGDAFFGCNNLGNITIPSTVTEIGHQAFSWCDKMTNLTIPASVVDCETAFIGLKNLEQIVVDSANPVYNSNGDCNAIIRTDSNTLILGCKNTKVPATVTTIGSSSFWYCESLESVDLPESVTTIGYSAYQGCKGLKNINLPATVTSIGAGAFADCVNVEKIKVNPSNPVYNSNGNSNAIIDSENKELVVGCKNTIIPSTVTSIGAKAFEGCVGLTSIEIPSSVTEIHADAFRSCTYLSSVELSVGLTTIGDGAFQDCSSLKSIVIPSGVTRIENYTFMNCYTLENVEIPSSVTSIGYAAFPCCYNLSKIEIPASVTEIEQYAFDSCNKLKIIYGTQGSYAQTYAKENGYQFVDIKASSVKNLKAAAAGKNKVKVTWDKVSGATGYIIYAKRNNEKSAYIGMTGKTSYTDTMALDNAYNYYFVYPYVLKANGKRVLGKCQKYAYAKGTCAAVTNLKASSVKGGVKLTWTKSAGADGYIVYGKKTNFKYGYIGMTTKNTATSYTDTKADKGNYNFYWIFPYHYDKNGKRVIGPICGYVYGRAK